MNMEDFADLVLNMIAFAIFVLAPMLGVVWLLVKFVKFAWGG
jgi:hypothetical protein